MADRWPDILPPLHVGGTGGRPPITVTFGEDPERGTRRWRFDRVNPDGTTRYLAAFDLAETEAILAHGGEAVATGFGTQPRQARAIGVLAAKVAAGTATAEEAKLYAAYSEYESKLDSAG